jgi:hypothetical protein
VDASTLSLAIVLGRSDEEIGLLRRCIDLSVPVVSTAGALRGLELALEEGIPDLTLQPPAATRSNSRSQVPQTALETATAIAT